MPVCLSVCVNYDEDGKRGPYINVRCRQNKWVQANGPNVTPTDMELYITMATRLPMHHAPRYYKPTSVISAFYLHLVLYYWHTSKLFFEIKDKYFQLQFEF